jgi:hypothetical protein
MKAKEIVEELKSEGYLVAPCNAVIGEGKEGRYYVLGEITSSKESEYLGKVMLATMSSQNRESLLQLENRLIDNKIPFQHQRKI